MSSHLMKRFGLFFCFFVCALKPFPAETYDSLSCKKSLQTDYDDIIPVKDFLYFLVDFEIYSTADFIQLKEEGLPDGVPEKPLRAYPTLRRQWSNLWRRVSKIRDQEQHKKKVLALITENPQITTAEMAQEMDTTLQTAQYAVNKLKESGKIARIGFSQGGYWEVLKNGAEPSPDPMKKKKEQVLALITENPQITTAEMAQEMDTKLQTAQYAVNKLKKTGKIARIGSDRSGFWQKLDNGTKLLPNPMEQRKEQLLALVTQNPYIRAAEMAHTLQLSVETVHYTTGVLKREERLVRIGYSGSGFWQKLENGTKPAPDPIKQKKEQVLTLMVKNPYITIMEIINVTGFTKPVIERAIRILKEEKRLARIGSVRSGYWEVLENGAEPSPDPVKQQKEQILVLVVKDPYITITEIARSLKVTRAVISISINQLKAEKKLVRVGSQRGGFWEVLEDGAEPSPDPMEQKKEQVLTLVTENPYISLSGIAHAMGGLLKKEVKKVTSALKKDGRLARIGSSRNGYWEVLEKGAKPSGTDPIEQRRERILTLVRENPKITIPQIATTLNVTKLPVRKAIDYLKEKGKLVRIGSTYSGHWRAIEAN